MDTPISSPPPAFDLMVGNLTQATCDVFADFGLVLQPALDTAESDAGSNAQDVATGVAVIGYAAVGVSGALVMAVPESAIYTWMDAVGVPDGELADTLGEFSNMLLGRLKQRLLPLGIRLNATTPTATTGKGIRISDATCPSVWRAFQGPGWRLRVRLDARFEPEFKLVPAPGKIAKAGEAIHFETVGAIDL
jgi:CheY-specific phosphatase CheX